MRKFFSALFLTLTLLVSEASAETGYVQKIDEGLKIYYANWPLVVQIDGCVSLYGLSIPSEKYLQGREARDLIHDFLKDNAKMNMSFIDNGESNEESVPLCRTALIEVGAVSLNHRLLEEGLAWINRKECLSPLCRRLFVVERKAREVRAGIWSVPTDSAPWQWAR